MHDPAELAVGLAEAFRYASEALVEKAAEGAREIECAVLGNDDPVASVAGEIVPRGHEFYDYEAKYLDEHGAQLLIPADLDPASRTRSSASPSRRSARSSARAWRASTSSCSAGTSSG